MTWYFVVILAGHITWQPMTFEDCDTAARSYEYTKKTELVACLQEKRLLALLNTGRVD